ncbi:hypothetical protein O181_012992 [Austropuccinia psidii MF-1]|uniref:GH26 domain-containing protein n=1 Tax=Austropuccinia psidii MF-1 TaxID=1389203 RepID=A0A9Q3GNI7_9BASI|nr:hypothetical protein [Austropuccinia psidii MF-1]
MVVLLAASSIVLELVSAGKAKSHRVKQSSHAHKRGSRHRGRKFQSISINRVGGASEIHNNSNTFQTDEHIPLKDHQSRNTSFSLRSDKNSSLPLSPSNFVIVNSNHSQVVLSTNFTSKGLNNSSREELTHPVKMSFNDSNKAYANNSEAVDSNTLTEVGSIGSDAVSSNNSTAADSINYSVTRSNDCTAAGFKNSSTLGLKNLTMAEPVNSTEGDYKNLTTSSNFTEACLRQFSEEILRNFTKSNYNNLKKVGLDKPESKDQEEISFGKNSSDYMTTIASNTSETVSNSASGEGGGSLLNAFKATSMKKEEVFVGFLPDDGSSGGTRETMAQLNSALGGKAAVYGWYAQAHSGTTFDGSQLLSVIDDVKACNCVFQPAVMPVGGWKGLTSSDNSQAVAIAKVMRKFTDEGIPVWLRFAHEVNYYQKDGTYEGTASDFKAGWASVSQAVKNIAPDVKMFWSPNVSTPEDYAAYEPDDMATVDLVGIDFYPKKLTGNDFLDTMKAFHDKYAVNGRKFAIGETGLGWAGTAEDKLDWFEQICKAKANMPEFLSMAWFNYDKEYDYKIAGEKTLNQKLTALIAS